MIARTIEIYHPPGNQLQQVVGLQSNLLIPSQVLAHLTRCRCTLPVSQCVYYTALIAGRAQYTVRHTFY